MPALHQITIGFEAAEALVQINLRLDNQEITPEQAEDSRRRVIEPYLPQSWTPGDYAQLVAKATKIISL